MAVIGKIRKHSGLLIVVIGVALGAFILGDLAKTQSRGPDNVGEINGIEITYKDFGDQLERNMESEKQRLGKANLSATEIFYIRQQTWMQFVTENIMGAEFEELGLVISSDELFELVQGNNPHPLIRQYFSNPQTGEYNPSAVLSFLQNLDQMDQASIQQWLQFEQGIKSDRRFQKYSNLVAKGYYVPEALAEFQYLNGNKVASVKLLAKKYADIDDSLIEITEDDLLSYYNDHKDLYELNEEVRGVDYVMFDVKPSVEDRVELTEQVNDLFEEFKTTNDPISFVNAVSDNRYDSTFFKQGELPVQIDAQLFNAEVGTFMEPYIDNDVFHMAKLMDVQNRPDSLRAKHVLFSYNGAYNSSVNRTKERAKAMADSLAFALSVNSDNFENIAKKISDDPSVSQNGGDLGYFADLSMVWQFNDAVLKGYLGEIKVVETPFGYHVIEVLGKKGFNKKVRVAVITRAIEPSSQTFQDYWTMASKFAAETETPEDFDQGLKELGIAKRNAPSLNKFTNFIPGIEYPRSIVRWAFDEKTEIGSISQIFDFDGNYVVAILSKIDAEGPQPFEDVRDLVQAEVSKIKKAEYIKAQVNGLNSLEGIAEKINVNIETVDVNHNSAVINLYGLEPQVVGNVFGTTKGTLSEVIQGNTAVYILATSEIRTPENAGSIEMSKAQLKGYFANRVRNNIILTALENAAEIEDNRHLFY